MAYLNTWDLAPKAPRAESIQHILIRIDIALSVMWIWFLVSCFRKERNALEQRILPSSTLFCSFFSSG